MVPGNRVYVASPRELYRYGAKGLFVLWAIYLLAWWFAIVGGIVSFMLLVLACVALVVIAVGLFFLDRRNYGTLYGYFSWGSWPIRRRIVMGVVCYCCIEFLPLVYLLIATARHFRAVGKGPGEYARQLLRNFLASERRLQAGVVVGSLVGVIVFCSGTAIVMAGGSGLAAVSSSASRAPTGSQVVSRQPTQVARAAATDTPLATADPVFTEQQTAQQLASENCGYTTNGINATYSPAYNAVEVVVTLGQQWDLSTAQNSVKIVVFDCFKGFYTSPHAGFVQDVHILVQGPVTDQYGNTSTGMYGSADLTRATQQPFNWQNLDAFTAWDNQIYDSQYVRGS